MQQMRLRTMKMHNYIHPLQQQQLTQPKGPPKKVQGQMDFKQMLSSVEGVKVSKHAELRMAERNIKVDATTWSKISDKMLEAKQKGVTDAVVLLDDYSFVVSTKNNTIITALNQTETANQIFTNINGTIVIQ